MVSILILLKLLCYSFIFHWILCVALALAISRDGSSGGVIRIACIEEAGVERLLFTGDEIPKFFKQ